MLIVDDHKMVRDGLKMMIGSFRNSLPVIVDEAETCREALVKTERKPYDLVIIDYHLPDGSAADTVLQMLRAHPSLAILALSNNDELTVVQNMLDAGTVGYLLKNIDARHLESAIQHALRHQSYYSNEISLKLLQQKELLKPGISLKLITPREKEVLRCILLEWKDDEISLNLGISKRTVQVHRSNLMRKLKVKNVAGLVKVAIRMGFLKMS